MQTRNASASSRVPAGSAELSVGGSSTVLLAGQQAVVDMLAQTITEQSEAARAPFDDWADQRDRKQDRASSAVARWASPEITGIEAVDDSAGSWRSEPAYGAVWYPNGVVADWAPYRYDRWAWVAPWGWSWVDDAPWGFATMHYGRWLFLGGRWGWVPGSFVATAQTPRPVCAPALVGFYGSASGTVGNVSIGIGVGTAPTVGWFPLGPGEIDRPAFASSVSYVRNVNVSSVTNVNNITNITNITNVNNITNNNATNVTGSAATKAPGAAVPFRYAQTSFAATVVSHAAFASGQHMAAAQQVLAPSALATASVAGTHAAPPGPAAPATRAALAAAASAALAPVPTTAMAPAPMTSARPDAPAAMVQPGLPAAAPAARKPPTRQGVPDANPAFATPAAAASPKPAPRPASAPVQAAGRAAPSQPHAAAPHPTPPHPHQAPAHSAREQEAQHRAARP